MDKKKRLSVFKNFLKMQAVILCLLVITGFITCDDFSIYNLENNTASPQISPKSVNLSQNTTCKFQGKDGEPPYVFSIQSGNGTIDSSTGIYTSPGTTGNDVILLTDSGGRTDTASVAVNTPLSINPEVVYVQVGKPQAFSSAGGVPPYTYTVISGGGSFASNIYTAPPSPGSVVIRVTDNSGSTRNAAVHVVAADIPIITPAVVTLTVGDTQVFTATGGSGSYTYSILSGGTGSIDPGTGLYTATAVGNAVVRVTDSGLNTSDAAVTVNAAGADPLRIIPDTYMQIYENDNYTFSAEGGRSPYTYTIDPPNKGTISPSTGYYVADGTPGEVEVIVTDSNSAQDSVTVKIIKK